MLNDLQSRQPGEKFDALFVNRATGVYIKNLLDAAPGNTAAMQMSELYGKPMLYWNGMPIVVNDAVGAGRSWSAATVSGTTLTVTDSGFMGFHDGDVGLTVTQDGNSTRTVASVTDSHVIELSTSGGTTGAGSLPVKNVIYALRFDEVDGIAAIYHANRGVPASAGEYYGPIAGFDAEDLGLQPNVQQYWTRLDFFGNVVSHSPFAQASLSHFNI